MSAGAGAGARPSPRAAGAIARLWIAAWLCTLGLFVPAANASTYTTGTNNCAGCHGGPPPLLHSQSTEVAGYNPWKIIPPVDDGALDQSCATSPCALRTKMNNNINMGASVTGSFTPAELETIRQYLLRVRDGAVGAASGAPTFPATLIGASNDSSFSFTVSNYRGTPLNLALTFSGANPNDYTVRSSSAGGVAGCTTSVVPAAPAGQNPSTCTLTVTLRFQPTAGAAGTRSAGLHVRLTAPSALDPAPKDDTPDKTVPLSATAVAPTPGYLMTANGVSVSALAPSTPVGSSVNASTLTITNPTSATGNLVLGSLAAPFSGAAAVDYALTPAAGSPCNTAGTTLVPGAGCNLVARFTPTAKGARNATLTIPHNATSNPATVALNGTGLQGTVSLGGSLAPSPFGSVNLGSSAQRTLSVTNSGDAALSFTSFTASGDFSVNGSACTSPLAVASSCTLTLIFTPTAAGTRSGTLTVISNGSNSPTTFTLTGSGVGLADPTVSPASVAAFPATDVGTTSTTTRVVTITNPRANSLRYTPTIGGANAADFAVGTESCASRQIAGGGTCTLVLRFTPTAGPGAGPRSASLGLAFTGSGSDPSPAAQSVALSGSATLPQPAFAVSANPIGFATAVGTPVDGDAVITNTGGAALSLSSLTFGGAFAAEYAFAASNTCTAGGVVAANGGSCTLAVRFLPAAVGSRPASLTIIHNAAGSPQVVTLSGNASAGPVTQPSIDLGGTSALAFGAVPLGGSGQQSFSVRNSGSAPLNLAALAIGGSAAAEYARGGSCAAGTALAPNTSCGVTVTFTPQATGARGALLTITSDAANTPSRSVTLSGDGVALAEPVVGPQPIDPFPATLVGSTAAVVRSVTITNPRANPIGYAASFGGADAGDFAVASESCATRVVPASGSCTIGLRFAPSAVGGAGNRSAALALAFTGTLGDAAPAAQSLPVSGTATVPTPVFGISGGTLDFTAVVGSSETASAVITNGGSAALMLSAVTIGGASASDYAFAPGNDCTAPLSLAPGGSCTLTIGFTPPSAGSSRDATVTIVHNAAGSPQTLTLRGTATAAPQGNIELDVKTQLLFAETALGSSLAQTIRVQNKGSAALHFSSLAIGGAAAADFERAGSCALGTALAAQSECTAVITFRPTALGTRTASITFQSDASNGPATIVLTGTAVAAPAPQVTLTPPVLAFGTQTVGGVYPKRVVRLTNSGTADLLNIAVSVTGAGFADTSDAPCPAKLEPGAGCDIGIAFTPSAPGAGYAASLSVASNAAGSPSTAALTGGGTNAAVPVLAWASPAAQRLDFGAVSAGRVSPPQTLTVTNQGPGGAVFTLFNAVGPDAANFPLSPAALVDKAPPPCGVGQPLFEGASCRIDVRFVPGSAGAKNATVQVVSTGSVPPALALTGSGLAGPNASLSVSAAKLSFDSTRVGAQSLPVELTLSSDGSGVVRVDALDVSGPYAVQAKSCPALPFTLPSGSACTLTLTFQPQAEGAAAGMLRVASDADPAQRQVELDGSAVPKADLASGGCSLASGDSLLDPTLWALAALAAAALAWRRSARRPAPRPLGGQAGERKGERQGERRERPHKPARGGRRGERPHRRDERGGERRVERWPQRRDERGRDERRGRPHRHWPPMR